MNRYVIVGMCALLPVAACSSTDIDAPPAPAASSDVDMVEVYSTVLDVEQVFDAAMSEPLGDLEQAQLEADEAFAGIDEIVNEVDELEELVGQMDVE